MKLETALVTRIIDTGDFASAKFILTSEHFFTPDGRAAWNYIARHVAQHGAPPSREVFSSVYPRFAYQLVNDPVPVLVERVHDFYVFNQINALGEKVAEIAKTDTIQAAQFIVDSGTRFRSLMNAGKLGVGVDITSTVAAERDAYYLRKDLKGLLGLPWPWPRMNRATFGIMPGQLCVFYARPKSMKTWLLLKVLENLHYHHKSRPILFTREMSVDELRRRFCALWAGVDYGRYMTGKLTTMEEAKWLEALEAFEEAPPVVIDTVPGSGEEAAEALIEKAVLSGADVIGVDGIYFFGNREWDEVAKFTSRLKYHLLNTLKVPCIGTTQGAKTFSVGKKGKNNLDDVGYSDAISQDADLLIKVALVREDQRLYLSLPGIREGESCQFQVWAKPAISFEQAFDEMPEEVSDEAETTHDPYAE